MASSEPNPSLPRRKVIALGTAALGTAVLAGAAWRRSVTPHITIPPAPIPTPNGYVLLAEAAAKIVRPDDIDRAFRAEPEPEDEGPSPSRADVRRLLSDNAGCLTALRAALSLPGFAPHRGLSVDHYSAEWPLFRKAARLLVVESREREASGDVAGAVSSCLDAVELGHRVSPGVVLIGRLVGIACESIGLKPLWTLAYRLDGPAARAAALRLEAIHAARVPFAATMEEERCFGLDAWKTYLADPARLAKESRNVEAEDYDPDAEPTAAEIARVRLLLLRHGKANLVGAYERYTAEVIRRCRLPYAEAARLGEIPPPRDPFNSNLEPIFEQARHKDVAASEVQNALLAATFAVRAYQAEQGALPERLEEVTAAGVLRRVPADPFSPDGAAPLRYRRCSGETYTLYSVGPDATDDGGRPIENKADVEGEAISPDSPNRRSVFPRSRGDVVAGVNLH